MHKAGAGWAWLPIERAGASLAGNAAFPGALPTPWPRHFSLMSCKRSSCSPKAPSAHMSHPAALHGQLGRLQPALKCLRFQQQRLAAPAGRGDGPTYIRRLMVAAAETPQERPAPPQAAAQCPPSLHPLDQSAPETATHPFSSLFGKVAAAAKVRRH